MAKQNYKQASKKTEFKANLDKLDSLGLDKSEFFNEEQISIIESICSEFIQRVKDNIEKEDMIVTGKIDNITLEKLEDGSVVIKGSNYLLFNDRGVNGSKKKLYDTPHSYSDKMPPVSVFEEYIRTQNIQLRNNDFLNGKESPFKELDQDKLVTKVAWAMAKKVFNEGFAPRHIFSKELPQLIEDLKREIIGFTADRIKQDIKAKLSSKLFVNRNTKPE